MPWLAQYCDGISLFVSPENAVARQPNLYFLFCGGQRWLPRLSLAMIQTASWRLRSVRRYCRTCLPLPKNMCLFQEEAPPRVSLATLQARIRPRKEGELQDDSVSQPLGRDGAAFASWVGPGLRRRVPAEGMIYSVALFVAPLGPSTQMSLLWSPRASPGNLVVPFLFSAMEQGRQDLQSPQLAPTLW